MSAEVWYRKWRPQSFAEITGQEHVTRTLVNAVAQGRVAHAYLLCGPRGTGKTTTARVLAKAVNCEQPAAGEPCNACESCRAVAEGRALDLVEMDAASNRGIDDIRNLRERVGYHPSSGRYRVYLIDEVHELTAQAFDALLKTLEEPPPHVIFVLATTDAHRVPATILSRCQRFDLTRIKPGDMVARLQHIAQREGIAVEPGALQAVARAATGALRDAVNLLEQLVASYVPARAAGGAAPAGALPLTEAQALEGLGLVADGRARDLALCAVQGGFAEGLALIAAVHDDGVDMRRFNREVVAQLRGLLLVKAGAEAGLDEHTAEALAELRHAADGIEARRIVRALRAFGSAEFRGEAQPSLPLELALADVALAPEPDAVPERAGAAATPVHPLQPPPPGSLLPFPAAAPSAGAETAADGPGTDSPHERLRMAAEQAAGAAPVPVNDPGTPATAPAADSLEQVRARLRDIYSGCRTVHAPTSALLNSGCDIIALDRQSITFGFEHAWMPEKLLPGTQAHRVLSGVVEQVLGRRLEVHCTHTPGVVNRLRATPPKVSHLLDEARKLGITPVRREPGTV